MNILFVLENYFPHIGGVEVVFKNLAEGLAKQGNEITIITHQLKGTKKYEKINNVTIHRIPCFHSRYWFSFLSIPLTIKLSKKADIIHTTTYNAAVPARFASIITKTPAIITVHEVLGKMWQEFGNMSLLSAKIHQFLENIIMKLNFNHFISVSKSTESRVLKKIKKSKSSVVYNGVDYEFFDPKKYDGDKIRKKLNLNNNYIYMFYGRPGISKGLEYLLKAVPKISKTLPNAKLLAIVSKDKAYKKRYDLMLNLIKELKIEENIILHDPVAFKEVPNYIKASDCVVIPSLSEGFGFTAAESCAMGKPIVASNTTSLPEVVSCQYILVKPKNPEEIANAVINIRNNKVCKTDKKIFRWSDTIDGYLKIYKQIKNKEN